MATATEEDKRTQRTGPAGFTPGAGVPTQPAPQFVRTNAGPMLKPPPAAAPVAPPAPSLEQQQLANQTAMYVQSAQAAAASRPAPTPAVVPPTPVNPSAVTPVNPPATPAVTRSVIPVNTMTQRAYAESEARKSAANPTGSIYGMGRSAAQPVQAPAQPLDAQAEADAKMFGRAWDATKGGFQRAGAAIADVATLPIRGVAGAYDTAVIRPMRAAGINAGFMSPLVNPESNANGQSMTPFYDQFRARDQVAQASTDAAVPAAGAPVATQTATTNRPGVIGGMGDARRAAGDYDRTKVATPPPDPLNGYEKTSIDGVYRKGNSFSDAAGTQDKAFQNRGAISPQNMQAADALAANYNTNQQALARMEANNTPAQARGFAPRQFDRAASIRALNDLRSPEAIALRNLRIAAEQEGEAAKAAGRAWKGGSPAGDAYRALLGELTQGTREGQQAEMRNETELAGIGMREAGATTRAAMGEAGATGRAQMTNDLQQSELGLKREAQGFTSRAAARLEKAQADYMAADTPEKKAAAAKVIRELQGKEKPESWKAVALQGGTDAQGNRTQSVLAAVNEATGEMRKFKAPAPAAPMPASPAQLESGKVYETNKGPATWDGENFTLVQQ